MGVWKWQLDLYLGHVVGEQAVQQLLGVLPLHDELGEGRQVDHSHLLHHQLALPADRPEPVGASETGPEAQRQETKTALNRAPLSLPTLGFYEDLN